jgi:predicted PurR-regulated permease PerM
MWPIAVTSVESLLRFLTFLISTTYLLLDGPRLRHWLGERIPPRQRDEVRALGTRVDAVLSEYLRAEVILVAIMSIASLIALTVLGVRFAVILAPLVGFLEIFPIIGPIFAIAMVTLMALVSPPNFGLSHASYAVIVALVFFIMRQLEDYLVIPNVVGHAVKLHPVVILFALLCGATIGGILGMFLAVPVTGALKVLGSYAYDRLVE